MSTTRKVPRLVHTRTSLENLLAARIEITPVLRPASATLFDSCEYCEDSFHHDFRYDTKEEAEKAHAEHVNAASWNVQYPYMEVFGGAPGAALSLHHHSSNLLTRVCDSHLIAAMQNLRDYYNDTFAEYERRYAAQQEVAEIVAELDSRPNWK